MPSIISQIVPFFTEHRKELQFFFHFYLFFLIDITHGCFEISSGACEWRRNASYFWPTLVAPCNAWNGISFGTVFGDTIFGMITYLFNNMECNDCILVQIIGQIPCCGCVYVCGYIVHMFVFLMFIQCQWWATCHSNTQRPGAKYVSVKSNQTLK